jgi:hypothetical protein
MAQWYNTLTATGKLKAEKVAARQGISQAVWSSTGTGVCELWRRSPDFTIDATGNTITFTEGGASKDTITRASGSWITDGFEVGDVFTVTDDGAATNAGTYTIFSLTATVITLIAADDVAAETNTLDTFTFTNQGTKIFSFVKTAGEKIFHFPDALRGDAYDGAGGGDLYAVLPATVTLWAVGRDSIVGD